MTRNVGPEDRIVRIIFAIGIAILIFVGVLDGLGAVVGGILAAYLLLSGLFTRCLIYKAAGIDTSVQEQSYSTTDDRSGL
ncbi:MAG: DUF2892 domain-containing protein [Sphingomonas sp.]|nr:DUF2892 domain-containing protein [Sphingomonas sp.]